MQGGDGNDVFLIASGADHPDLESIGGGAGINVIRFTSETPGDELVLSASTVQQVVIGNAAGVFTGTTALDLIASNSESALAIIGNNGANVVVGTTFADVITGNGGDDDLNGNSGNDLVSGGAGNDTLRAGSGIDTLAGGAGNDTYVDVNPEAGPDKTIVSETLNMGTDTVQTAFSYILGAYVENLLLLGAENVNGTGNTLNNVLTGNSGANILNGMAGNDTLTGGLGLDTVMGGTGNDRVTILAAAGDVDVADGGVGGVDTLALSGNAGGTVNVDLSAGAGDQVATLAGLQNNFENLDASGLLNPVSVIGSAGANVITGSALSDTLAGGAGNDTYHILTGDQVTEGSNQGIDQVNLMMSADYILPDNVERLTIVAWEGGAASGNVSNNIILDNSGLGLALSGGAGLDVLNGGAGNDTLSGGTHKDT
jgi:Ca2+-binding RTX toxin-like protein